MIDKLDVRIPRHTEFSPAFKRLYPKLQALEKRPLRPSKYYEFAGDLREYGFNVRLNLYCQMEKVGNHKVELIDVGEMSRSQIFREIQGLFDVDPRTLELMRVDFAVDVPDIPVQWFRETVHAQHKRFRSAVTGERFYCEMGSGEIQTLYFGKRPNLIRIYDKVAEYKKQYRDLIRKLPNGIEPPTFQSLYPNVGPGSVLTRVERQIAGRMPVEIETLRNVTDPLLFNPFSKLKIIDHDTLPERGPNVSFETYCTGLHLHKVALEDGMQAANKFISKHSNGNTAWARKKYASFFPSASRNSGLTEAELQARFAQSLAAQMSA